MEDRSPLLQRRLRAPALQVFFRDVENLKEEAAMERLELYCKAAQAVSRTTPIRGIPQPPETEP